ncbi:MOSC domain-containing protein [Candidatus Acetothermia bacterium]|nr:MOSC domain-containing protein [Candidatus Acetothermia bacterium]MBI3643435.1 MOSC domain-containing protein [Candidatus Acetothermia bacterium]
MWQGIVHAIGITAKEGDAIQQVRQVRAIPGKGLEGDRYFKKFQVQPDSYHPSREITLIEVEALEAMARENEIELEPINSRRNVVTQGVPLNHLVGKEFQVGRVRLKGVKLCEPCTTLEGLTQKGVIGGLVHRGGLRAQILTEGIIQVGDPVKPA